MNILCPVAVEIRSANELFLGPLRMLARDLIRDHVANGDPRD